MEIDSRYGNEWNPFFQAKNDFHSNNIYLKHV